MKVKTQEINRHLKALDKALAGVLIYGPDEGLVDERAARIMAQILPKGADPMLLVDLSNDQVKAEPSRAHDEMAEAPLFGGRKLIRVERASDAAAAGAQNALEDELPGFLLITAGDLKASSSLRKLFEKAPNALAIPCYADSAATLDALITEIMSDAGLKISADARAYLLQSLGADRRLSRAELEKLTLYMASDAGKSVSLNDARQCVADSASLMIEEIASAALDGDGPASDKAYARALNAGESPIAVIRALLRRLSRLHEAACHLRGGLNMSDALGKLRPPVFWKEKDSYEAQLRRWSPALLGRAMGLVLEAEIECKTTGIPSEAACGRALMRIAQAAGRQR